MEMLVWAGIVVCISQSAMFSGLNLAFFSLTRLRLEIEAETSDSKAAQKVLKMRRDSNFLLTTILWGNVGINVLLTLLSDSVLAGIGAFLFSTVAITLLGEIVPQAYFSRNALKMASILAPVLKIYQILLYPVAKPSAVMLDLWLGRETVQFLAEKNIKLFIKKHMENDQNDIGKTEGAGAINFLSIDDLRVLDEGEPVNADSIIQLPAVDGKPQFPAYKRSPEDAFLRKLNKSGEKWVVFVNEKGTPLLVLDADGFLRASVFGSSGEPSGAASDSSITEYCHVPITISDATVKIGSLLKQIRSGHDKKSDLPIDRDIILFWGNPRKIITGADLLGRLLKGI